MTMNQFAMIEELAFLIKDNLPCKHLVLSVEESLVDFLLNDTSPDGILELEPMTSYNRLLLHRLADIFGFAHESIGEGDDRHLLLERSPESSIPPILVSDILWQHDEYQSPPTSHKLLRRKEAFPASKTNTTSIQSSLEEREAAYLAARQRIFSVDDGEMKSDIPKPRNIPVVARRMIAHALGQRISSNSSNGVTLTNDKEYQEKTEESNAKEKTKGQQNLSSATSQETTSPSSNKVSSFERKPDRRNVSFNASQSERVYKKPSSNRSTTYSAPQNVRTGKTVSKDNLKQEHLGAAKRLFAHALGLHGTKEMNGLIVKCNEANPIDKE